MRRTMLLLAAAWFLTACGSPAPSPASTGDASVSSSPAAAASATAALPVSVAVTPAPAAQPPAAAQPARAPAADAAPKAHARGLTVDRLVVARGVEGREPLGADTSFAAGEKRVFAFVEVRNPERAPGEVRVEFVAPDGKAEAPVSLEVGESLRWRTWAFTRLAHAPGTWHAVVRDERGHVLASTAFDVRA